jgi:small subunit ribosomal protein S3Ae
LKKEWWEVKAPGMFANRKFTKSPVNVSAGKKLSSDTIKGRVFECNLGDLNNGMNTYKKIKFIVDDTSSSENRTALTNFYGMDTTKDHLCSLIRKWHTLIETFVDAKTSDGFLLRFFPIAFTARLKHQLRATTYAQISQVKLIRQKMREIITKFVKKNTLKEVVNSLIVEKFGPEITAEAKKIFPIQNCIIRKVKTLKRPRFDSKLRFFIFISIIIKNSQSLLIIFFSWSF